MNFGYRQASFNDGAVSVGEANRYIKTLMENDALLSNICVRGEISNLKYHSSGHLYFTLKDEEAELSAVMFRSAAANMKFTVQNGMKVRAFGRVSMYEKSGKCQIYVFAMTDDGIGNLQREYEMLRKKLSDEGLFDKERKRQLPRIPDCIGIITSPTGAAIRDIINVTGRRWPNAKLLIYPSLVQGADAPESLCRGVQLLNAYGDCDVIIIGRGGGSIEDLWAFNNEALVRAVAASKVPIISAVGHETDFTLCDFAADCRAPTPSAAAELAVPDKNEYRQRTDEGLSRIDSAMNSYMAERRNRLSAQIKALELCSPVTRLSNEKKLLSHKKEILDRTVAEIYRKNRDKLSGLAGRLAAVNPLAVLSRGYSITVGDNGKVISSVTEIKPGNVIGVTFADGTAKAKVIDVDNKSDIRKENL